MFLSAVFPLGEKSGVNLRGNFNVGKGTVWEEKVVKGVFMQWFSKEGYLQRKEFAGWLAGSVDVIGLAEKERRRLEGKSLEAKEEEGKSEILLTGGTGEDVDVIEVEGETSKTPSGKKGKARKKV